MDLIHTHRNGQEKIHVTLRHPYAMQTDWICTHGNAAEHSNNLGSACTLPSVYLNQ